MVYDRTRHAAAWTDDYLFHQLIPYIGNKRRLLGLIQQAIRLTDAGPGEAFADLFAGSGVVSRLANSLGFQVLANDWEPYAEVLLRAALQSAPPPCTALGGYASAIDTLNTLPPQVGWVTRHLCPADDAAPNPDTERLFYMRKNGERIDAIRSRIADWQRAGRVDDAEAACLLAPLLYQACYTSNTSGVFKGFHRGWGGQTGTALYRIAGDLRLAPLVFWPSDAAHQVTRLDAHQWATERAAAGPVAIAYLDPPYNQHPYGSNYHVLNSIALWDQPNLPVAITPGTKSGIRRDWRTQRRSAYNHRRDAAAAYRALIATLPARWLLTSYSTDGTIDLTDLLAANADRGDVRLLMRPYKRYRVSSQRYSPRPHTLEFVVITEVGRSCRHSLAELLAQLEAAAV